MRKMLMVTALIALVLCAGTVSAVDKPKATAAIVEKGGCNMVCSYAGGKPLTTRGTHFIKLKVTNTHFEKAMEKVRVKIEARETGKRVPVATLEVTLNLSGGVEPRKNVTATWPIAKWTYFHSSEGTSGEAGLVELLDFERKKVTQRADGPNGYGKITAPYEAKYTWKVKVTGVIWYEEEDD